MRPTRYRRQKNARCSKGCEPARLGRDRPASLADYLGVGPETPPKYKMFHQQTNRSCGFALVNGWEARHSFTRGKLVEQASADSGQHETTRRVHHPLPCVRRWLAQSIAGAVHIAGTVTPPSECGNGVTWSLNVRRAQRDDNWPAAKRMPGRSEGWGIRWCFGACRRRAFAIDRPVHAIIRATSRDRVEIADKRATPNGYEPVNDVSATSGGNPHAIDGQRKSVDFYTSPMSRNVAAIPLICLSKMLTAKSGKSGRHWRSMSRNC